MGTPTALNPKLNWWRDNSWIDRYKPHLLPDAVKGPDWKRILDRRFTLLQLAKLALRLRGSTADCGVYRGVSSAVICETLKDSYQPGEQHWGFDSFEGLSRPTDKDGPVWHEGDLAVNIGEAQAHLKAFPFCNLVKGWIPDCLFGVKDASFRFVHIDLDIYEPTKAALEFFHCRLERGAVIVFDDFGFLSCPGAREAVTEFMAKTAGSIVELTTGQAFIVKE